MNVDREISIAGATRVSQLVHPGDGLIDAPLRVDEFNTFKRKEEKKAKGSICKAFNLNPRKGGFYG
jgi:hypothetical protein